MCVCMCLTDERSRESMLQGVCGLKIYRIAAGRMQEDGDVETQEQIVSEQLEGLVEREPPEKDVD